VVDDNAHTQRTHTHTSLAASNPDEIDIDDDVVSDGGEEGTEGVTGGGGGGRGGTCRVIYSGGETMGNSEEIPLDDD
jgi:hypothetical protein